MPFPIELKYIKETEEELGVEFPKIFKEKMQEENGGEFYAEGEWWFLFPFFDKSDKKRISRTCNHIILETKNAMKWNAFPKNSIAVGTNQSGDYLILREIETNKLSDEIYIWYHETREIIKVGKNINDYEEPEDYEDEDDF